MYTARRHSLTHYELSLAAGRAVQGQFGRGGKGRTGAHLDLKGRLVVPIPPNVTHISPAQCCLLPAQKGAGRGKKRHNNIVKHARVCPTNILY